MLLEAKNLTYSYRADWVVRDFSLSLSAGDFTILLGPNGSGKSTILRLLAGYLPTQQGEVTLAGRDLAELPSRERARQIAVLPQTSVPALDFSVEEIVMLGRNSRRSRLSPPSRADWLAVHSALERLDLRHLARRSCNRLSGGEYQRVCLAAVLAQEAQILLLDEPCAALDPANSLSIMQLLSSLPGAPSVLLISHNLTLAARYARQVVLIKAGRTIASGSPEAVLTPANIQAAYGCASELLRDSRDNLCLSLQSSP